MGELTNHVAERAPDQQGAGSRWYPDRVRAIWISIPNARSATDVHDSKTGRSDIRYRYDEGTGVEKKVSYLSMPISLS